MFRNSLRVAVERLSGTRSERGGSEFGIFLVSSHSTLGFDEPAAQAIAWADRIYNQFDEQKILKARLREAANAWEKLVKERVIVVIREVWDVFARDEQYLAAFQIVPTWLYFGQ